MKQTLVTIKTNIKTILSFADSEFLELLIAILHTFLLPLAVITEIGFKWHIVFAAFFGGLFQFYSVGMRNLNVGIIPQSLRRLSRSLQLKNTSSRAKCLKHHHVGGGHSYHLPQSSIKYA